MSTTTRIYYIYPKSKKDLGASRCTFLFPNNIDFVLADLPEDLKKELDNFDVICTSGVECNSSNEFVDRLRIAAAYLRDDPNWDKMWHEADNKYNK